MSRSEKKGRGNPSVGTVKKRGHSKEGIRDERVMGKRVHRLRVIVGGGKREQDAAHHLSSLR